MSMQHGHGTTQKYFRCMWGVFNRGQAPFRPPFMSNLQFFRYLDNADMLDMNV